jgi:ABC-2 type transporter
VLAAEGFLPERAGTEIQVRSSSGSGVVTQVLRALEGQAPDPVSVAVHEPVDYLMPGIFAQSVCFGAIGTAVGLSADLRSGILVRFRTLPMARIAVLGGRTMADLARNLVVVAVMIGVGFAAGFRSANGAGGLLAALGLVVAFGYAISWGFAALGLRVSDPEAAQAAGVPVMFLLVFWHGAPGSCWRSPSSLPVPTLR